MYIHVFVFSWKDEVAIEDKAKAAQDIAAFSGVIPGLLEISVGENLASNHGGFTFGGVMKFADEQAYRDYCTHPVHLQFVNWIIPFLSGAVELDLPSSGQK